MMNVRNLTPEHLQASLDDIEVGTQLLVVGFPLGFHDMLHHLPVVRHAINASPYGLRFQGNGYFLTDARTHRGTSGASVVKHSGSYGNRAGTWELAVTHGPSLCYATKITGDVLGWVDWNDIPKHLERIAALPENPLCRHKRPEFNG
jgi:hypothetical protein